MGAVQHTPIPVIMPDQEERLHDGTSTQSETRAAKFQRCVNIAQDTLLVAALDKITMSPVKRARLYAIIKCMQKAAAAWKEERAAGVLWSIIEDLGNEARMLSASREDIMVAENLFPDLYWVRAFTREERTRLPQVEQSEKKSLGLGVLRLVCESQAKAGCGRAKVICKNPRVNRFGNLERYGTGSAYNETWRYIVARLKSEGCWQDVVTAVHMMTGGDHVDAAEVLKHVLHNYPEPFRSIQWFVPCLNQLRREATWRRRRDAVTKKIAKSRKIKNPQRKRR